MAAKKKADTPEETTPAAKRIGHVQRIKNLNRIFGSNQHYVRVRLQEEDGEEFTVLFTEDALKEARDRSASNPEDVTNAPLLVDATD